MSQAEQPAVMIGSESVIRHVLQPIHKQVGDSIVLDAACCEVETRLRHLVRAHEDTLREASSRIAASRDQTVPAPPAETDDEANDLRDAMAALNEPGESVPLEEFARRHGLTPPAQPVPVAETSEAERQHKFSSYTYHAHPIVREIAVGFYEEFRLRLKTERDLTALQAENDRLRTRLLTAAGDDLCRLSQEEIKAMSLGEVKIPPKEEFLASCERFHAQVAKESGVMTNCLTLAQLVAENERLKGEMSDLRQENTQLDVDLTMARACKPDEFTHVVTAEKMAWSRVRELDSKLAAEVSARESAEAKVAELRALLELAQRCITLGCGDVDVQSAIDAALSQESEVRG
jgi:hypothetical protein